MTDIAVTNRYHAHYPPHQPRAGDPHYHAFEAYRRKHVAEAKCYAGQRIGTDYCAGGLELHHRILEFAVLNAVSIKALEMDFPNLTDPEKVKAWAETDANFMWLCAKHHRGFVGVHHVSDSDWEASLYDPGFLS